MNGEGGTADLVRADVELHRLDNRTVGTIGTIRTMGTIGSTRTIENGILGIDTNNYSE